MRQNVSRDWKRRFLNAVRRFLKPQLAYSSELPFELDGFLRVFASAVKVLFPGRYSGVRMLSQVSSIAESARVFVADVSRLDCQLLAASLQRNRIKVESWETNSRAALAAIERSQPDVALIAARLDDGERAGLSLLPELQTISPKTLPVMLLDVSDRGSVVEAFTNGAKGVFTREQMSPSLAKCIRCVLAGQLWVSNEHVEFLVQALRKNPQPASTFAPESEALTRREREVGTLVARGLTNRDIAEQLGLSEHTVKNYLLTIFEKLRVSTRVELALLLSGHSDPHFPSETDISSGRKPPISA